MNPLSYDRLRAIPVDEATGAGTGAVGTTSRAAGASKRGDGQPATPREPAHCNGAGRSQRAMVVLRRDVRAYAAASTVTPLLALYGSTTWSWTVGPVAALLVLALDRAPTRCAGATSIDHPRRASDLGDNRRPASARPAPQSIVPTAG